MLIQNRWKGYYEDLLNVENRSDPLPATAPVHGPEPQVTMGEVATAIKNMKPRKAGRPKQITADVIKMMDKNAEWLWQITTKIWSEKKIPKCPKRSIMVAICKQKGDVIECKSHRGIELLEHVLKIIGSILEKRLRKYITIDQMQFGCMPGRGTVDAIFILRQVQGKPWKGTVLGFH